MIFHNIQISQYVNHVDFIMCEFKQRMKDNFISEMNTFFNESPKCHLGDSLKNCINLTNKVILQSLFKFTY